MDKTDTAEEPRVLGVIPVRGGSKRIPRKNIREVGGKPLLAHTIEQAAEATTLDRTIVSSDDEEIREVAREHGGDVPFERPAELATDDASSEEVIAHALEWCRDRGEEYDLVCMLQVTSPFRTSADIDEANRKLAASSAKTLVSVTEFEEPPFWALDTSGRYMEPYFEEQHLWTDTRSQDFPSLDRPNGAVFAAIVSEFDPEVGFYTDRTIAYRMPQERSLDIDDPAELEMARALMSWREG